MTHGASIASNVDYHIVAEKDCGQMGLKSVEPRAYWLKLRRGIDGPVFNKHDLHFITFY